MNSSRRLWGIALVFAFAVSVFGQTAGGQLYRLSSGDQVTVSVFGEPDLAVSQRIDDSGKIVMPLLGEVQLAGLTVREAETLIKERFVNEDFLVKPEITIQITGSRSREFYIFGEVRGPGMKQFPPNRSALSIVEAISMAGDFTEFARSTAVQITRRDESGKETVLSVDVRRLISRTQSNSNIEMVDVLPGDVVFVPQSRF
jgi:protein involved in polysaccharide export with SLBB domain